MMLSEIRDMKITAVVLCVGILVLVQSSQTTATHKTVIERGRSTQPHPSSHTQLKEDVSAILASQALLIEQLTQRLDKQEMKIAQLTSTDKYLSTELGCVGEEITLSCSDGKTLLLTGSDYGEYYQECGSECCPMHPYDCTESMSTSNQDEWIVLKLACDLQTTCTYLFQGSTFVDQCTPTNAVDYLSIYYRCEPESVNEAVGFSVYASEHREYVPDDVILFDGIISNFGNHYDPTSSIFLCPYGGVYMFGINILAFNSEVVNARIMLDDTVVVGERAGDASSSYQAGSNLVVVQCSVGQKVWVISLSESRIHGDGARFSTFTGYLLLRT